VQRENVPFLSVPIKTITVKDSGWPSLGHIPILGSVTMARLIVNCNLSTLGYMPTSVAWRVGSVLEEKRKVLDGGEEGLLTYIVCVHPSRICKVLLCESCLLSLTETL
jgi:hypothetical protein